MISSLIKRKLEIGNYWCAEMEKALSAFWFHSVEQIVSVSVRDVVVHILEEKASERFFVDPSSSTKKNHPSWQNKISGLLRHVTEMCIGVWRIAQAFPQLNKSNPQAPIADILLPSIILHDAFKNGLPWGDKTDPRHHEIAAYIWLDCAHSAQIDCFISNQVHQCIWWHAGRFTPNFGETLLKNDYIAVMHLCDMVYSDNNLNLLYSPKDIILQPASTGQL